MEERVLRDFAIQAAAETIDAIYDSGFNPCVNWKDKFIKTYDSMVKSYKYDCIS